MPQEFKHYGLKTARKAHSLGPLSSVVLVLREDGAAGFCHVRFSPSLVQAVGKKLPRGVSLSDPAYLHVMYAARTKTWDVWAFYLEGGPGAILWKSGTIPAWLKFRTESTHGNTTPAQPTSARPGSADTYTPRLEIGSAP